MPLIPKPKPASKSAPKVVKKQLISNQPFVPPRTNINPPSPTQQAQATTQKTLGSMAAPIVGQWRMPQLGTQPRVPTATQEQMLAGQTLTKPLPFMALGWTPKGEPYYGPEGPLTWAKKLYARIFDPEIYMEGKTYQEKQSWYDRYYAENPQIYAGTEYEKSMGVIGELTKQNPFTVLKVIKQMAVAVIPSALQFLRTTDWASRKLYSVLTAEVEMANTYSVASKPPSYWEMVAQSGTAGMSSGITVLPPEVAAKVASFTQKNPLAAKEILDRHLAGSEMVYTALVNRAKAEEYTKRYLADENPDFIVEDLANPLTELGIGMVMDLGNALYMGSSLGGEAASKIRRIASWKDDILRVVNPEVAKGLEAAKNAPTEVEALKAIEPVFGEMIDDIAASKSKLSKWATNYGFFTPTSSARTAITTKRTYPLLRHIIEGSTPEDAAAIFESMILAGSGDVGEATRALAYLSRTPFAPMFFSAAGTDTMALFSSFADNMGGMNKLLAAVRGSEDTASLVAKVAPVWRSTIDDMFPTFSEMEKAASRVRRYTAAGKEIAAEDSRLAAMYNGMSSGSRAWVGAVNSLDKTTSPIYRALNSFFSWNFMGLTYGYAFRNIMQDSVGVLVEEGPRVAAMNIIKTPINAIGDLFTNGAFSRRAEQGIVNVLGYFPAEAAKGLGAHAAEDTSLSLFNLVKEEGFGGLVKRVGKAFDARTLASGFEKGTSMTIFSNVLEREMKNVLNSGFMPGMDSIYASFGRAGLDKTAADTYVKLVFDNWGDVGRANQIFREAVATGILETFRLRKMPDDVGALLGQLTLRQPFDDLLRTAQNPEEFQRGLQLGLDAIHNKSLESIDAIPRVDMATASANGLDSLDYAIREGMISVKEGEIKLFNIRQEALNASNSAFSAASRESLRGMKAVGLDTTPAYDALLYAKNRLTGTTAEEGRVWTRYIMEELFPQTYNKSPEELEVLWKSVRTPMGWVSLREVPKGLTPDKFRNLVYDWWSRGTINNWQKTGLDYARANMDAIRLVTEPAGVTDQVFMSPAWLKADKALHEMDIWYNVREWDDVARLYGEDIVKQASERLPNATMADMDWDSLSFYGWKRGPKALVNAVNADRRAAGLVEYVAGEGTDLYSQVPFTEAVQSIFKRIKGLEPPIPSDATPFLSQFVSDQEVQIAKRLEEWGDDVVSHWGETQKVFTNTEVEKVLGEIETITKPRLLQGHAGALAIAQAERDWILHAYDDQTYIERFLAHIYLFPYWYIRSTIKWPIRLAENPQYLIGYAKYRRFLEQLHAGMPDWWKYNLILDRLPGGNPQSPMYFNLEQTLNPMYGMTGVDFNDNIKRATWYARAADDMTKFGPSLYPMLNWVVAGALYHEGKTDAGNRWLGRLMPITATMKYAAYKFNINTGVRYNDFDPFTQLLMGGIDPYEYAPIGRASGAWVDDQVAKAGTITDARKEELYNMYSAQAQDAITARSGPLWEEFVARMASQKAPGRIASFFAGAGFKLRTQDDLQIDKFWNDYFVLENARSVLSPLEYRDKQASLRQKYPWMDSILLSRLPDDSRYRSFAYNVLARIAPGQISELFPYDTTGLLGISGDMLDEFYNSKGDLSKWTPQDKDRFMVGMVDLSALLSIPDYATQVEWNVAKDSYAQLKQDIGYRLGEPYQRGATFTTRRGGEGEEAYKMVWGEGVWEKVYYYYNIEDRAAKEKYITDHPEVEQAMNLLTEGVMADSQLMKYYGGLDTLERYYTNKMYDELYKQFPSTDPKMKTVGDEWSYYYDLKISGLNIQADVLAKTPGLQQYIDLKKEKKELMAQSFPGMQTLWDTYDYGKWIGRITGNYSLADAYYAANPQLKAYSDASKQLDLQIVNQLTPTIGMQAAIDLEALYTQYQNIANETAYAYRDAHSEMDKYLDGKASALKSVALEIGTFAKNLPEVPQMNIRSDFIPQGTTQTALANLIRPTPKMTLDEYIKTYKISDATWTAVKRFFDGNKPLPSEVKDELDYLAQAKGEDGTTLLLDLAAAYYQQVP